MDSHIKAYSGLKACRDLANSSASSYAVSPVASDGNAFASLYTCTTAAMPNYTPFLISGASAFTGSYDESDYSIDSEATVSINSSYISSLHAYMAVISVTATSDISLTAIKFYKGLYGIYGGAKVTKTTLLFGYFFDSPVSMASGETKTFTFVFD